VVRQFCGVILGAGLWCSSLLAAEWPACDIKDVEGRELSRLVVRKAAWRVDWGIREVSRDRQMVLLLDRDVAGFCDATLDECTLFALDEERGTIRPSGFQVEQRKGKVFGTKPQRQAGGYRVQPSGEGLVMTVPGTGAKLTDPVRGSVEQSRVTGLIEVQFKTCRMSFDELAAMDRRLVARKYPMTRGDWPKLEHLVDQARAITKSFGGEVVIAPFHTKDKLFLMASRSRGKEWEVLVFMEWFERSFKIMPLESVDGYADQKKILEKILREGVARVQ
jgi:hypothetical protein